MKGQQKPRIQIEPKRCESDGQGAAMLMQAYGLTLDEWQRLIVDCWLGKDKAGAYTVTSAGLSVPRQNGKNVCIEAREFYGLTVNGERILHTAHQVRTAKKAFRRLVGMFTDKKHPEITKAVKKIRYGIGEESIELNNGGIIEFTARSRQAARGYDGISLVVYDEAQELTDEQAEAIMAVLSASATGTRQLIYTGTPPYVGCTGEVFRRFRQACIMAAGKGEPQNSSWHEWGIAADNITDINTEDKALWYEANPALGYRLTEEFTQEEHKTLSPDGFARERLGWWAKPAEVKDLLAIDAAIWDSCASDEERPEGKTAYGVKFSRDGAEVVLAGAVIPKTMSQEMRIGIAGEGQRPGSGTETAWTGPSFTGEKGRISLIAIEPTGNGLQWLANWLNARYKQASCIVIDGTNGADVLIEKLKPSGGGSWVLKGSVIKPTAQNVIAAAGMLINDLNEGAITWYSRQEELRDSAITATKRPLAGGWAFGGQTSTPIEACALALWGCRTSKRDPSRKMRIG